MRPLPDYSNPVADQKRRAAFEIAGAKTGESLVADSSEAASQEPQALPEREMTSDMIDSPPIPFRPLAPRAIATKLARLIHKDIEVTISIMDASISEHQIALLLAPGVVFGDLRFKSKFKLIYDNCTYSVSFIGGSFEFNVWNTALRILSFVILDSKLVDHDDEKGE